MLKVGCLAALAALTGHAVQALPECRAEVDTVASSLIQVRSRLNDASALIPQPQSLTRRQGQLEVRKLTADLPSVALRQTLDDFVGSMIDSEDSSEPRASDAPLLSARLADVGMGAEGYALNVTSSGVDLVAETEHGLFNGIMTLRQLLQKPESGIWQLPLVSIRDKPALPWRGLMLDVSRHFFFPKEVKHLLRTMALFKMNHFHWHLTDDQGWRFPVEKYPKLISLGAARRGTPKGHTPGLDGQPYNHSYTVEEIEDILSLAESLHIEVMPEFDLPGHNQAAIASYPEMGNADAAAQWHPEVATQFGALQYTLNPTDRAVNFTKDILSELVRLFPATPYVHIGGDEVPTDQWARSPAAKEVAAEKHLSLGQLEGLMLGEAAHHLQSLHRKAVVWDEALESGGDLPKDSVVMIWRSWMGLDKVGDRAAQRGHSVVLAPQTWTYLDQWQDTSKSQFDAIGGYLPLSKVYSVPTTAGRAKVLGLQGQLWSEYIREGEKNLDFMAWPRGCALAEAGWLGEARPSFNDFRYRLQKRAKDFEAFAVNLGQV